MAETYNQSTRIYDEERNVNVIPTDWSVAESLNTPNANMLYEMYAAGSRFNDPYKSFTQNRASVNVSSIWKTLFC